MNITEEVARIAGSHPHGATKSALWIISIAAASLLYFLMYFYPVSLHDNSHFATAGVSLIRDHKDLLYPYHPHGPSGTGNAYEYFQNNTVRFDARTNYPSKLYSAIYGLICALQGNMRLEYVQWISFVSFLTGNLFLYLIGSRFFVGTYLFLFLISVNFLPLMRMQLNPGMDGAGYVASLALVWLSLCLRVNPLVLGLYAGVFAHLRGQMLSVLLVFPFLYRAISGRAFFRQALLPMTLGFFVTYAAMSLIFSMLIESTAASNPVGFYTDHFKNSLYGFGEIKIVLNNLLSNFVALFDKTQVFIYAGIALLFVLARTASLQRSLAAAAILYIALPLVLYSFYRFASPPPRYYLFAVALIALAVFAWLRAISENSGAALSPKSSMVVLAAIIVSAWYATQGFPVEQLKPDVITSRARFLDFNGVESALATNFKDDDIVIVNHSLPSGLSRLHNFIYVPPFKLFQAGDNSRIKGIIFVFGDTPPNDFFKPKDWFQGNTLPAVISDSKGIVFKQVYERTSTILNPNGSAFVSAHFYIYKNAVE